MIKYICDCCGEELIDEECFKNIKFIKESKTWDYKVIQNKIKKQVCKKCYSEYLKRCRNIFAQLQEERSGNND